MEERRKNAIAKDKEARERGLVREPALSPGEAACNAAIASTTGVLNNVLEKKAKEPHHRHQQLVVYVANGREYRHRLDGEMWRFVTRIRPTITYADGTTVTMKALKDAGFEAHRIFTTNNAINANEVEKGVQDELKQHPGRLWKVSGAGGVHEDGDIVQEFELWAVVGFLPGNMKRSNV